MRVAYIVSRYPWVSHAFILREVQALRALGVEVDPFTVVRAEPSELIEDATRQENERTTALRPIGAARLAMVLVLAFLRRPGGFARAVRRAVALRHGGVRDLVWQLAYVAQGVLLARLVAARGIRHLHAHHANVASDVALYACTYDARLSWSLTLHGPTELADVHTHRLAEKLNDAALVSCISDFARAQAMALVPAERWERLRVVHLGVDLDSFAPRTTTRASSSLHVLSVGRLSEQKAQPLLLEAVALARSRGFDVRLTLVGDGPLRPLLERLAGEGITLAGAVGHDRLAELYRDADVFCLTSVAEGVPVVLMEAMACELPVVAPRIMGIPELVDDGVNGVLVAPARADLVADAFARLADADRAAMGRAGREKVSREFELQASARAMRALLEDAATA